MAFERVRLEKGIRLVARTDGRSKGISAANQRRGNSARSAERPARGITDARHLRARLITDVAQGKHGATSGTFRLTPHRVAGPDRERGSLPQTVYEYRQRSTTGLRPPSAPYPSASSRPTIWTPSDNLAALENRSSLPISTAIACSPKKSLRTWWHFGSFSPRPGKPHFP
jgi:hypothetical protein